MCFDDVILNLHKKDCSEKQTRCIFCDNYDVILHISHTQNCNFAYFSIKSYGSASRFIFMEINFHQICINLFYRFMYDFEHDFKTCD